MSLEPVEVQFQVDGVRGVQEAFRTVAEASLNLEKQISKSSRTVDQSFDDMTRRAKRFATAVEEASKAAADAQIRDNQRVSAQHEQTQRTMGRGLVGGGNPFGGSHGGLAGASAGASLSSSLFSVSAGAFVSAIDLAGSALKSFGSFLLHDVVAAELKAGKEIQQLANSMSGTDKGKLRDTLGDLGQKYAGVNENDVFAAQKVSAGKAGGRADDANLIADIALKATQAQGGNASHMAEFVGSKRQQFAGMNEAGFRNLIASEIYAAKDFGVGTEGLTKLKGRTGAMADRFAGGNESVKAANDLALTSLVSAGARTKGAGASMSSLETFIKELERESPKLNEKGVRVKGADGTLNDLTAVIPQLLRAAGGDANKLGKGAIGGGTLGDINMGMGFSSKSVNFLKDLGLDRVYRDAEKEKKGSGTSAVERELKKMMAPASDAAAKIEEDFKKVDSDPLVQFEQAVRRVKDTFAEALMPTVTEKILPALIKLKPVAEEFAKAVAGMLENISGDDLAKALKMLVQVIAGVAQSIAEVANDVKGGTVKKQTMNSLAKLAGLEEKTEQGKTIDSTEAQQRLHPADDEALRRTAGFSIASFVEHRRGVSGLVNRTNARDKLNKLTNDQAEQNSILRPTGENSVLAADKFATVVDKFSTAIDKLDKKDPSRMGPIAQVIRSE